MLKSNIILSCLLLGLSSVTPAKTIAKGKRRPNILFILADDQRNDLLSCAGHPVVKTPTIDRLAKKGVRFTNAFVTTSICAASRATILTGLYEYKHGYTFGKEPIKQEDMKISYPYMLKRSGYKTGFVGKLGIRFKDQQTLIDSLFDYNKVTDKNAPYFEYAKDGTRRHSAEVKGDQAIEFINQQHAEQPFCLSVSFNAVHAVDSNRKPGNEGHYPYPESTKDMYRNVVMPTPKLLSQEIINSHPNFLKTSINRERYFWRWDTPEKYQVNMRAYFRMITGYDQVISKMIKALKRKGLAKNTVIIYMSDNGYYMGERGFAGKWSHYEESLRIPMIIYDPRMRKKDVGRTVDHMALNLDIAATIMDYAGVPNPTRNQGISLMDAVEQKDFISKRSCFFIEHRMDHRKIPKYYGVRSSRYVYVNYYDQNPNYEFLHDLDVDPSQRINYAKDPAYKEIIRKLSVECRSINGTR
ncbi:sulfatase [Halosquirtibacter xylanolyticus]|uniref:sulfatase family protein n=1 Tax=Halosquirtibacter xylanolyticus TaxID=3374599 RepID=UPI0037483471|nr:sulfatase [Prolixibacteraceae bacterium]